MVAGIFSNVAPGIKTFIEAWVKEACVQMWWKMDKRCIDGDDIYDVLNTCFEPEDLAKIEHSKWSRTKGMAVIIKKKRMEFDFDGVFENDGTVDYTMGLDEEE